MDDYAARNAAGQQATVEMLRNILEAVLGIQIGDDVIGRRGFCALGQPRAWKRLLPQQATIKAARADGEKF